MIEPHIIELTPMEIVQCGNVGVMRVTKVIKEGRGETHGSVRHEAWGRHVEGAMGEAAMCRVLDVYWPPGEIFGPDAGHNLEARTTRHEDGRLIIHRNDKDDHCFFLVVGCMGRYRVVGWMMGGDAKQDKYWSDPGTGRPAYFVPQHELNTVESWQR